MIHIEKDQKIAENPNLRVASNTADYNDTDFIQYYSVDDPGVVVGAFQAQFVKYGGLVYRFNDFKELGAEILKIDPQSTHSTASFVRMNNELLKQMGEGSLEPESLNNALTAEQTVTEEKMMIQPEVTEQPKIPDTTDTITTPVNTDTSTTTPPIIDTGTSTTTPPIIDLDTSTSTPPFDTSTTTPPIIDIGTGTTTPPTATTTVIDSSDNSGNTSTTTEPVVNVDTSTTTPPVSPEPVNTGTTTDEIVAFAKKKIVNKLFNI